MNNTQLLFKILLGVAILSGLVFITILLFDLSLASGPFLTIFFISLAISFQGFTSLKRFSYTIWIFAAVTAAMYYPQFFTKVGDFELKALIVPLLQIIMFGMGSQMSIQDFKGIIKMPKGVFVGIICQFTIMPVIGITIASSFGFAPEIAAGIVLVGSSPSGLASNVMSFLARANLALSVTLTAVATLLAPIMTPTLMKLLAGQFVPIDFWNMMIGIIEMVILPIVAGLIFNAIAYGKQSRKSIIIQAISYFVIIALKNIILFQTSDAGINIALQQLLMNTLWFLVLPVMGGMLFKQWARGNKDILDRALAFISMLGIAVIITIITAAGRDSLMEIGFLLILACLLHNMSGYFLGYWGCRLLRMDEKSCRTIALEVGMQNGGLASGIALQMGKVATIGLAPAVFGPMMNITGSSLATWWRSKKIKEEDESLISQAT